MNIFVELSRFFYLPEMDEDTQKEAAISACKSYLRSKKIRTRAFAKNARTTVTKGDGIWNVVFQGSDGDDYHQYKFAVRLVRWTFINDRVRLVRHAGLD